MQYLLLARHGNTFAPGQKSVWVGVRNDLPLVESGIVQAQAVARAFEEASIVPQAIYAASLQRTTKYAQIVDEQLSRQNEIVVDKRLNEIDYGAWSGLSNEEIAEKFGLNELEQWNKYGKWLKSFVGTEDDLDNDINSFVQDKVIDQSDKKIILAVTSNGRLKYFLKLIPDIYAQYIRESKWKVGTGQLCVLSCENKSWKLECWNKNPSEAIALLKNCLKV